jgi:HAD superfamily hydrolase (TIGR01509 family)
MNIIIPCCGLGQRFINEGYNKPKPLIDVINKPMIFYLLDNLKLNPDDIIYIIYNFDYEFIDINYKLNKQIKLIKLNHNTGGAIDTVLCGYNLEIKNSPNNKCILLDCDTFYTIDILELVRNIKNNACLYTFNDEPKPIYSYIKMQNNIINDIAEKTKISNYANTGAYFFLDKNVFIQYCNKIINYNYNYNNEFYTSIVIKDMINEQHVFEGILIDTNNVFSLGTPLQLQKYINQTFSFLFDLDGTLVITDSIYFNVWSQILKKYNIILTQDLFKNYIQGHNDSFVINNLLYNFSTDLNSISYIKDTLFIENINDIIIVDNAINFIRELKMKGHKVGIVTNCNKNVAYAILNKINVFDLCDVVITNNDCTNPKPSPEPYLKALELLNLPSEKCFIFEDSNTGILSARSVAPKCIIGITTNYSSEDLINSSVNLTINDYNNIDINNLISYQNNEIVNIEKYIRQSVNFKINSIVINKNKLKGGFISDVISLKINNHDYVIKLENKNKSFLQTMAHKLGLYEREYYFYEAISKYVPVNIPKFIGLIKDNNFNNVGILMENLIVKNYKLNLNLNNESIDVSLKIIDELVKLHTKFWNIELKKHFKELNKNNDSIFNPVWSDFINEKWPIFKNKWFNLLSDDDLDIINNIVQNFPNIQQYLSDKNLTLCHGDVKSPNIFYKIYKNKYIPYFIDWQYISIGKGVQDLVFFMIESFDIHKIKQIKNILIDYYYIKILESNINYDYYDYINDIKHSICYFPFFVMIWFGTVNDDDLIDKNFPFFFIQKFLNFYKIIFN